MKRLLLLLHMPPPVHGVTAINQQIASMIDLHCVFSEIRLIPLSYGVFEDLGKISPAKLVFLSHLFFKLLSMYSFWGKQVVLFSPALKGLPLLRDILIVLLLRMGGATVVNHIHGRDISELSNTVFYRFFHGILLKSGYVICLSENLSLDVSQYVSCDRTCIVSNGIRDPYSHQIMMKAIQARQDRSAPKLLFLSTMMKAKGVLILLDALALLKARRVPFRASFAGSFFSDFSLPQYVDYVHALKLEGHVNYLGAVFDDEKYELFLDSDVFILPTLRDTFPLVALEAMAAGLPVVASKEGALPEIVQHGKTGYIFPTGDTQELADCLQRLCENSALRCELSTNGRRRFTENYTDVIFKDNLIKMFQGIEWK